MSVRVECLTPRGSGGVAVLSLRGPGVEAALRRVGVRGPLVSGRMRLVRLIGAGAHSGRGPGPSVEPSGELLDEGLLCVRSAEEAELHVHGSPGLVDELLALLPGAADPARPGGGASRPAGLEQRALALLPGAPSEAGARTLLDQAGGALRAALQQLEDQPDRALAATLAERGRRAGFLLRPTRVVLVGPANAGKSTLFNVLVGAERVLATAVPGTTRDAVHEAAWLGPWPLELVDTAGERDPGEDRVEAAGQEQALRLRAGADWSLRLCAAGEGGAAPDLWTHGERPGAPEGALRTIGDPAGARRLVRAAFEGRFQLPSDPWAPGTAVPFVGGLAADLRSFADGQIDAAELRRRLGLWLAPSA